MARILSAVRTPVSTRTSASKQHVFIVDDEAKVLDVLKETLESLGVEVSCFVSASQCLERLRTHRCDLLITNLKMREIHGMELLTIVKRHTPWVPVLVMTSDIDVPTAVRAIKTGAVDIIVKPPDREIPVGTVQSTLEKTALFSDFASKHLSWMETKILILALDGHKNDEIADLLSLSVRTIGVHRAHMKCKLDINNLVDLAKLAATLGLVDLPSTRRNSV